LSQSILFGGTTRTVKIPIIILTFVIASTNAHAQLTNTNYSGRTAVAGLGEIAFPAGEWLFEFQRIQHQTNSAFIPDHFVFKRVGNRLERLTFLRYPPTTSPRRLDHMLDTIGETMGDGIPWEEKKLGGRSAGAIQPMRLMPYNPTPTERRIEYSFIHVLPSPAPSWLCHSILFSHDGSSFVIAHASTSVIDPEVVGDVQFRSQFFPDTKPARDYK
jgi:hypothetical protein